MNRIPYFILRPAYSTCRLRQRCFVHGHSRRKANTAEGNSRASRETGLLCSHSHGEYIDCLTFSIRLAATRRRPKRAPSTTVPLEPKPSTSSS